MDTDTISSSTDTNSRPEEAKKSSPAKEPESTPNGRDTLLEPSPALNNLPTKSTETGSILEVRKESLKEGDTTDTEEGLTIDLSSPPPLTPPPQDTDVAMNSNGVKEEEKEKEEEEVVDKKLPPALELKDEAEMTGLHEKKRSEVDDDDRPNAMETEAPSKEDKKEPSEESSSEINTKTETDSRTVSSTPPALVDTTQVLNNEPKQQQAQEENETQDGSSSKPSQDCPSTNNDSKLPEAGDASDLKTESQESGFDQVAESPKLVIDTGSSEPIPTEAGREPPLIKKSNESMPEKNQENSEHKSNSRLQSPSSSDEMEIQLNLQDNELSDDDSASDTEMEVSVANSHLPSSTTCIPNTDHQTTSNLHSEQSSASSSPSIALQQQQHTSSASIFNQTHPQHRNTTPPSSQSRNTGTTIIDNSHTTPSTNKHQDNLSTPTAVISRRVNSPRAHSPAHHRRGGGGGGDSDESRRRKDVSPSHRIRQVAKVKQFFSTLQQVSNKMGSEVAEQVQELISAVVNETATIEEFHQEVQTVTNHPLKDFIIPFLRENLGYLRDELKESSHALSDILGDNTPIPNTIGLTPQLVDEDLPVLPSSNKASGPIRGVVSSSVISHAQGTGNNTSKSNSSSSKQTNHGTTSSSSTASTHSSTHHQSTSVSSSHSLMAAGNHMDMDSGFDVGPSPYPNPTSNHSLARKRPRSDRPMMSSEKEIQTISSDKSHSSYLSKRPRHDDGESSVITTNPRDHHHLSTLPPSYPQPPPTHPLTTTPTTATQVLGDPSGFATPLSSGGGSMKLKALNEDWGHVQFMLNSIQGMVDRTRQAVVVLKERINITHSEMERQEMDVDNLIQQHVKEALDKARKQATEEKNRLLLDASKQLRETVATVKSEVETRMAQQQSFAIQEAIKEANVQTNSKENCWNCGRRATETCSGCNKARYCGTFCQHKDWANHMHHCASGLHAQATTAEEQHFSERQDIAVRHHAQTIAADPAVNQPMRTAKLPQGITSIPVNVVGGNELALRMVPGKRIPHSHTDIAVTIKTEKT